MKKLIIIIGIFFWLLPALGASLIYYDANDVTVPNRVITYTKSGDQTKFLNDVNDITSEKAGYLVNTDLSGVDGVAQKYWKVVGGAVVEMTQEEKDDIDILLAPIANPLDDLTYDADDDSAADSATDKAATVAELLGVFGVGGAALVWARKNARRIKALEDK